jgi:hypothetical protein
VKHNVNIVKQIGKSKRRHHSRRSERSVPLQGKCQGNKERHKIQKEEGSEGNRARWGRQSFSQMNTRHVQLRQIVAEIRLEKE